MKAAVDIETGDDSLLGHTWTNRACNCWCLPAYCFSRVFVKGEGTAGFLVNCCICCPVAVVVECYELVGNRKSGYNHNDLS